MQKMLKEEHEEEVGDNVDVGVVEIGGVVLTLCYKKRARGTFRSDWSNRKYSQIIQTNIRRNCKRILNSPALV